MRGPSFEQTWITCTQRCIEPSLVEIGPVVLEKNYVNMKSLRQQRRRQRHFLSLAMVTCPNEWKILEWDEELQTSKQTNKIKSPWFWFCMLSLVQVGSGKDFQMLTMHFHCCYYIPLLKDMVLQMNNNISIYFLFIFFSILCKSEGVTLHWTNLKSLH